MVPSVLSSQRRGIPRFLRFLRIKRYRMRGFAVFFFVAPGFVYAPSTPRSCQTRYVGGAENLCFTIQQRTRAFLVCVFTSRVINLFDRSLACGLNAAPSKFYTTGASFASSSQRHLRHTGNPVGSSSRHHARLETVANRKSVTK